MLWETKLGIYGQGEKEIFSLYIQAFVYFKFFHMCVFHLNNIYYYHLKINFKLFYYEIGTKVTFIHNSVIL